MFSGCPSAVTYVRARSCVPGRRLLHCESKKQDIKLLPTTSPNINRFPNNFFFTGGLSSKFATQLIFKYSTTP